MSAWSAVAVPFAVVLLVSSCASSAADDEGSALPADSAPPAPSVGDEATTTAAPVAARPDATEPADAPAAFTWRPEPISDDVAARMVHSWREGCPVGLDELRHVSLTHWGFDGEVHEGELVVHRDDEASLGEVFAELYELRFPIHQVRLVDDFEGDDGRSMAANNTSVFNCRTVSGTDRWSEHAYGRALDINPVQNPYVDGPRFAPTEGSEYLDRSDERPGMLVPGSPALEAFRAAGWQWGGDWTSVEDYHHLSRSGR